MAALEAGEDVVEPAAKAGRRPEIRKQSRRWEEDKKLKEVVEYLAKEWFIPLILKYGELSMADGEESFAEAFDSYRPMENQLEECKSFFVYKYASVQ